MTAAIAETAAATERAGQSGAGAAAATDIAFRIGPNAVIQLLSALRSAGRHDLAAEACAAAGMPEWLDSPPSEMVDERIVARLHRAVRAALPLDAANLIMAEAGRLTALYLLANRIPRPVQLLLKCLPSRTAASILVKAISAHAWTFAGSGTFTAQVGNPTVFTLSNNPLIAGERAEHPLCAWHTAVFERLFQALVSRRTHAAETECEAEGDITCRFILRW
ncbi:MAG: bacteriochlorophyll 4-vinyl reductase [Acetobacteraceae bacterium]|nr:bacteriochlorophyll 4-vinyl reductase [Pseudomonadota bacterium]